MPDAKFVACEGGPGCSTGECAGCAAREADIAHMTAATIAKLHTMSALAKQIEDTLDDSDDAIATDGEDSLVVELERIRRWSITARTTIQRVAARIQRG